MRRSEIDETFDNAIIGEDAIIEPGVQIGLHYHPQCGPARIGSHAIIRAGSIIYGDVQVGNYFQSGHHAVIRARVTAGDYFALGNGSTMEGLTECGNGVRIMSHVYIPSRTRIGHHVFIGPGTTLLNDTFPGRLEKMPIPRGPIVEDEAVIGGGCTILPGVRIGRQSFIAAGAVVTKDVPPHSLVVGVPGKIRPLPEQYDRPNHKALVEQPIDLWHPKTPDLSAIRWGD